jgi:chromosome segregation ATPase
MSSTTAKGGVDEGVQNLERFIALVMSTIEQVQGHTTTVEQHDDALESLVNEAEGALADLAGALTEFEGKLESAEDQVEQELGTLRDEAREGTDQRLEESSSEVESGRAAYDDAMSAGRSSLEESHSSLGSDGFSALGSALESAESALAEDRQEAEASLDGLDTAVADFQQRATQALADAEGAFDQTVEEIKDRRDALETEGTDSVTAFDAAGDDIDAEARSLGGELEGVYNAWATEIDADGSDLILSVETLLADLASFVDTASEEQLDDPAATVLSEGFEPYLAELAELQAVLEGAGGPTADALLPLVDELERSAAVIDTIDKLLDTLES